MPAPPNRTHESKRQILRDGRGASPTIGVVLIVGMAVILAMAVSVYAFGVVGVLEDSQPRTGFSAALSGGQLEIHHSSGEPVPAGSVLVESSTPFEFVTPDGSLDGVSNSSKSFAEMGHSGDVTAGDSVVIVATTGDFMDDTVRVVYVSADGSDSAVLYTWKGGYATS